MDTSVVAVTIEGGRCSGVMVQSRVVMTAAHCALLGAGRNNVGTVDFADVVPSTTTANIIDLWIDRDYDPTTGLHDIALLRIDRDAPAIAILNAAVIPQGSTTLVGYGESTPGLAETYGTRSSITLQVLEVDMMKLQVVALGEPGQSTCTGDSGGGAFELDDEQNSLVFGVIVSGTDQCDGDVNIDIASDKDITTVIQAWSGPCPADGVCDPTCDNDPDCDPCAFQGTCQQGCPNVDLDCPVDGLPGATCVENAECESRVCTPAPEGADRGSFCSSACTTAADCVAPLDDCSPSGLCVYADGTPGIPGAACSKDADCRTLLCDDGSHTCAVQCGPDFSCPVGLLCQPVRNARACTAGDACNAGGRGSVASGVAILLAIGISRRRRRLRR